MKSSPCPLRKKRLVHPAGTHVRKLQEQLNGITVGIPRGKGMGDSSALGREGKTVSLTGIFVEGFIYLVWAGSSLRGPLIFLLAAAQV